MQAAVVGDVEIHKGEVQAVQAVEAQDQTLMDPVEQAQLTRVAVGAVQVARREITQLAAPAAPALSSSLTQQVL